ncbi:hypothetical protein ACWT_1265 [Actinoplanes sp. SE50]|uniref:hypothetical protein n=1 Tax=unclassified Actinoplanes TaxID=2626549 RepID=UPI00023EBAFD|nr:MULTISPECIES: hypothetical protein [unclassified Actinoplanes]AEV82283.1 hypothetical protein ACPL_1386 [Actinoplanes sp. SE50/110]ATO80680.1 hypothetical protein ACWT_1265 [Actinoplanes sp. SE50]SLL98087.1 hypothetical protein ACSP50_1309 [Actinoplanes sp. SE50/110]
MIRRNLLPATLLLAIAGCAQPAQTGQPGAGTPSSPAPVPGNTAAGTTISGTVAVGTEPGCLLLQNHLLIISDPEQRKQLTEGSRVRVTGVPQPGLMTTCQQGEPFAVSSVTPG